MRMIIVPFYGWIVLKYGFSVHLDPPNELYRVLACILFAVAALSDLIDGHIARKLSLIHI